jgi:polyphenol oxidase
VKSPSLLELDWQLPPGVRAACTTRLGGVSEPPWDSFNLAMHVGDAAEHVATNREQLRELLSLSSEPAWLSQVHGVEVANLDDASASATPITADASITSRAGPACVVMVADCLPVLFCSKDGSRVGAAHAGWRGLAAGVLEQTIAAMGVPGEELRAWLGPAISREHFEVGAEVGAAFSDADPGSALCFFANDRGRWQADLIELAKRRLAAAGVTDVSGGKWCTFAQSNRFFSHRRDGHANDGHTGRFAALIWKT